MKKVFISIAFVLTIFRSYADEGMWLPHLLSQLNEGRMKSLGMKISATDIYSINKGSLKDAIVSFGGFCTGEIISTQGLLLTNHHCGFSAIQNHSSLEHNYIQDGFWAMDKSKELPNNGLFVTFIIRIDDVTTSVLAGTNATMTEKERQSMIDKNIASLQKTILKETTQNVIIKSFFEGNQYYAFVTETYRDVRLVGAPPSSIGNFGKDTDNWMWPRHTGDFSMFRIYANRDNKPAEYSADNVPYIPKKALNISLSGIDNGDFTMIFGFPGKTTQYLPSVAVEQIVSINDPAKILVRDKTLEVIDKFMRTDEKTKIQYAAKWASISNAWKKWQGEVLGLKRTNAVAKKVQFETTFQERVNTHEAFAAYKNILPDFKNVYAQYAPYSLAKDYFTEIFSKLELFTIIGQLNAVNNAYKNGGEEAYRKRIIQAKGSLTKFFKDYNSAVDKKVFEALLPIYLSQPEAFVSAELKNAFTNAHQNYTNLADYIFQENNLYNIDFIFQMFNQSGEDFVQTFNTFKTVHLYNDMVATYQREIQKPLTPLQEQIDNLQRTYTKAQLAVMKEKKFYPDANSTMRITYGQVNGYQPKNGVYYEFLTDLDGVIEKYKPGDYEFDLPEKLIKLHTEKDYGIYGKNGKMPVCFIASNHTTGGNSGSPALDAYGNLIGLNFDRVWEGTMSDINYDASICRNIMVDIRYVLFITDKFANAGHLVKEMNIVYPKNKKK
ncbi:MAG: S46 family peptidase [Chitinophagaceae bacterium]|nr:S46 family peptidase [Chitinophagaceae bacterium]MCW5905457.1 S46 family peptidase [Chitinophagaceae bacterium]